MWGGSGSGTAPSALFQNQGPDTVELSAGDYLYDVRDLRVTSGGKGERADDGGGKFPAGEFEWECVKYD